MKKAIPFVLALGAAVLVGCGGEPELASSVEDYAGTWQSTDSSLSHLGAFLVTEDGSLRCSRWEDIPDLAYTQYCDGEIWFEGTEMHVLDTQLCAAEGVYEVQLLGNGNIKHVIIEDDHCRARVRFLTGFLTGSSGGPEVDVEFVPITNEPEAAALFEGTISSLNPVTTPDDEEVGESRLERATNGIKLIVEACCLIPGNAYTAWWGIGDVTLSMSAVSTPIAAGWVAESEELNLELELEMLVGGPRDPLDGVRIFILDHGPDTGDPSQLTNPSGGCTGMCPTILETAHPAP